MKTNKLHTIKNSGFKVPEDYFNTLEDTILSDLKLKTITRETGYKVPENYFDSLEDKITASITAEKDVKVIKLFTKKNFLYATSIAASLILMFNLFFNKQEQITIDGIETASLENYIINEDVELTEFAPLFTEDDLSNVHLISDGFSPDILEDYVLDNLEIEDIIIK